MPDFLLSLKSRLMRPVMLVLFLAILAQLMANILITHRNVGHLVTEVNSSLADASESIAQDMSDTQRQLQTQLSSMSAAAQEELAKRLGAQLDAESEHIREGVRQDLESNIQQIAAVIADIAPPAIWDRNVPELTRLADLLDKADSVVFVGFFDQYGERLTRNVDRNDPKVMELLEKGEGQGALGKVIDAAQKDPSMKVLTVDIAPHEVSIGKLVIGISSARVDTQIGVLKKRFEALTAESRKSIDSVLQNQLQDLSATMNTALSRMNSRSQKDANSLLQHIEDSSRQISASLALVCVVLGLLLFVLIAVVLGLRILRNINLLQTNIWDIAEGDADLTQRTRIAGDHEIATMAQGFNRFIERIQRMLQDVKGSATTASDLTGQLARTSSQAQQVVNNQKQLVDQVSAAITEMTGSIQQTADDVQAVAGEVQQIKEETQDTANISEQVRDLLNELRQVMATAGDTVSQLNQYSGEIGSVLDVIRTIADQTNLLALNAAIEAARAGESGRGFAVVADEVRALASKTQQSTTEIQQRIHSLQQGSGAAVSAIGDASSKAESSLQSFAQTDQHLDNVHRAVMSLYERATALSKRADQQRQVAEEIRRSVGDIHQASEETDAAVAEAADTSAAIDATFEQLSGQIAQFRI